jgi:phosphatidate cytidylyltransferase
MSDAEVPQGEESKSPGPGGELFMRVVAAVVLGVGAVATAWAGGLVFLVVWTAAAAIVWWEWVGIVKAEQRPVLIGIGIAAVVGMAISLEADAAAIAFVCAVVGAGIAMSCVQTARHWTGGGVLYAATLLIPAVMLRSDPAWGFIAIIWLFAVVWAEDTGAYFTGRFFGGPKLAVSISPSKTWSGAAGGTVAGILAGNIVILVAGIPWRPAHLALAFAVAVAAQLGDLLESAIKRRFAVKDASSLVPGHGGLMDRLDGFLIAVALALAIGFVHGGVRSPASGLLQW